MVRDHLLHGHRPLLGVRGRVDGEPSPAAISATARQWAQWTTGVPHDIASSTGSPNPSWRDGITRPSTPR